VTDLDNWPRLVQLAWLFYGKDGRNISGGNHIIKPSGFMIPAESSAVHGITTEKAMTEGMDLRRVLSEFQGMIERSTYLIGHNVSFDANIIGAEFLRQGMKNSILTKEHICTMKSSVEFCALQGNYGYKWPKLEELHRKLFGEELNEAHNAVHDINATARCFWELKKRGVV